MRHILSAAMMAVALLLSVGAGAEEPSTGKLSGQMKISSDLPMSEGLVYLYNRATGPAPSYDRYWRVPDFAGKLDKNGRFTIDLPPGEYFIGAIKRNGPTQIGPPHEGDRFIIGLDESKVPRKYSVVKGESHDIGAITGAISFKELPAREGITAIEGMIKDVNDKPIEGVIVFAFVTPTVVGKPLFVSDRSNKNGKYLLRVHEGGTYYLKVRDNYGGGPPVPGGIIDGNKDQPMRKVSVKTGEIVRDVNLKGRKFPGRGPEKE